MYSKVCLWVQDVMSAGPLAYRQLDNGISETHKGKVYQLLFATVTEQNLQFQRQSIAEPPLLANSHVG